MGSNDIDFAQKQPPFDSKLERAVISALMTEKSAQIAVLNRIKFSEVFYQPEHEMIFACIQEMFTRGKKIDVFTISNDLRAKGQLDSVGGLMFLTEITVVLNSADHVLEYSNILMELWMRRLMIKQGMILNSHSLDRTVDVFDILDKLKVNLMKIENQLSVTQESTMMKLHPEAIKSLSDAKQRKDAIIGIKSHLKELDECTLGFQPGKLYIVAGRPGMGKTAFMVQIMKNVSVIDKIPVALFSIEMSAKELTIRLFCLELELSKYEVIRDMPVDEIIHRTNHLVNENIIVDDSAYLTASMLKSKLISFCMKYKIKLAMVDYLQLMSGGNDRAKNRNREQEISDISRSLKVTAKELDIPIIAAAQLSRAVESRSDKRPILADLRESGSIEQDADGVIFLCRPEYYSKSEGDAFSAFEDGSSTKGRCEVIIAKMRDGETGYFISGCRISQNKFWSLPHQVESNLPEPKNNGFYIDPTESKKQNAFDHYNVGDFDIEVRDEYQKGAGDDKAPF